jgi:hypothetical protein
MRIRSIFRRLNRGLERFNDSFGGAAVASGAASGRRIDPERVTAALGELERKQGTAARENDRGG